MANAQRGYALARELYVEGAAQPKWTNTHRTVFSMSPLRVLLVEDNAGDANLITERLRATSAGSVHDVVHVKTLADASRELGSSKPAVLLLDLGLPDAWGLDGLKQLSGGWPAIPIIVLTGFEDETIGAMALRQGAQDFLVKGRIDGPGLWRALTFAIERKQVESLRQRLVPAQRRARVARLAREVEGASSLVTENLGLVVKRISEATEAMNSMQSDLATRLEPADKNVVDEVLAGSGVCLSLEEAGALTVDSLAEMDRIHSKMANLRSGGVDPAGARPSAGEAKAPAGEARSDGPRARILLVGDEPSLLRAVGRVLGRRHTVTLVEGGEEALRVLHEGADFDLLICDLTMRLVDGVEFWQTLREMDSSLLDHTVFMSGGVVSQRVADFLTETKALVLDKPVTGAELLEVADRLMAANPEADGD